MATLIRLWPARSDSRSGASLKGNVRCDGSFKFSDLPDACRQASINQSEAAGVTFHEADVPAYRKATASFYTSFPKWPAGLHEKVLAAAAGK